MLLSWERGPEPFVFDKESPLPGGNSQSPGERQPSHIKNGPCHRKGTAPPHTCSLPGGLGNPARPSWSLTGKDSMGLADLTRRMETPGSTQGPGIGLRAVSRAVWVEGRNLS